MDLMICGSYSTELLGDTETVNLNYRLNTTVEILWQLWFEAVGHSLYSSGHVPSDFDLFILFRDKECRLLGCYTMWLL
jgi:hypothetical protein